MIRARLNRAWGAAIVAGLLSPLAGMPARACQLTRVAQVPIVLAQGFALVPLGQRGQAWPFLLDTGAQDMLITPIAAAAMGLAADPGRQTPVLSASGTVLAPNVVLQGLSLGGVPLPSRSVPAAVLPGFDSISPVPAGIIGVPALAQYDVLLDVPARQLSLYAVSGCATVPVPFEPPVSAIPLRRTRGGEAMLTVQIAGRPIEAMLDTGARGTILSSAAAARLGRPAIGLRVGADTMPALRPTVAPLPLEQGEALLGMDYLGARRVWISYATDQVIVQMPRSTVRAAALAP